MPGLIKVEEIELPNVPKVSNPLKFMLMVDPLTKVKFAVSAIEALLPRVSVPPVIAMLPDPKVPVLEEANSPAETVVPPV